MKQTFTLKESEVVSIIATHFELKGFNPVNIQLKVRTAQVGRGPGAMKHPEFAEAVVECDSGDEELIKQAARLRILRKLEWDGGSGLHDICPLCGANKEHGHEPDCDLGIVLKGATK